MFSSCFGARNMMKPRTSAGPFNIRNDSLISDDASHIISLFLTWSNEWLEKRNCDVQTALEVLEQMPSEFTSFENYKTVMISFMKLEFLIELEKEYIECKIKPFKVMVEDLVELKDRVVMTVSSKYLPKYDLVILNFNFGGHKADIFAYVCENRKEKGKWTFRILSKNYTMATLSSIKKVHVRPVLENIRVEIGAFQAVLRLNSTPLFRKILNPFELLKDYYECSSSIQYKGIDALNKRQAEVVINTYSRIIRKSKPNITLIKGPPGTGKSHVICNLALQSLYGDEVLCMAKKIIICAHSNAAVDLIAAKLLHLQMRVNSDKIFKIIRFGMSDKINPENAPITLKYILEKHIIEKKREQWELYKTLVQFEGDEEVFKKKLIYDEIRSLKMQILAMQHSSEAYELFETKKQLNALRRFLYPELTAEEKRRFYTSHLENANIVCTTLSGCVNLLEYIKNFDVAIIDEATQSVEPWSLLPLQFGITSLVLVGDTQQLPATVLSMVREESFITTKKAKQLGYGKSMFARIQHCLESGNSSTSGIICSLNTQYRMHPEICKWPNLYCYKNELINADITQTLQTPIAPFSVINLAYSQNKEFDDGKISNDLEAKFVVKLLKALDKYIPHKANIYGIITPYSHQRTKLEVALKASGFSSTMVNTIDSYQGIEKDVIIISNARTRGVGFLSDYQRLNVALTRPRKCLILCGNFKCLESVPVWKSLLSNARERHIFHEISTKKARDIPRNVIEKIKVKGVENRSNETIKKDVDYVNRCDYVPSLIANPPPTKLQPEKNNVEENPTVSRDTKETSSANTLLVEFEQLCFRFDFLVLRP